MFMCLCRKRTYNDHGEEGEAHEHALHLDEQHGAWQFFQHGVVEAGDQSGDFSTWFRDRKEIRK